MTYDNSNVRRQDRLLTYEKAVRLLTDGEYGVLSMQAENGGGYGVPVNYVWDGRDSIYIHCAPEGRKLRCLATCDKVSFCIIGHTRPVPDMFTTEYESIVLSCTAATGLDEQERMSALEALIGKYSPDYKATGRKYAEKSFHRTEIIRLTIVSWSGKCKALPRKG